MRRALSRSFTCHSVQAKVIGQNLIRKTIFGTLCSPPYLVMSHNWKAYCTCLVASTHAHAGYEFLHLIGADSSEQDHCNSLCIYIYIFVWYPVQTHLTCDMFECCVGSKGIL